MEDILFNAVDDCFIEINDIQFHKSILIAKVPYFEGYFNFNKSSNQECKVSFHFDEYDQEVIKLLKVKLYYGKISIKAMKVYII
jgi:hypothetical protein